MLDSYSVEIWNGGKVHVIHESIIHLMRGQVFTINGSKFFTFGGARSHDKEFRKENINWWAREMPSNEEYIEGLKNLEKHNWNVDFVVTHTCPASTIELFTQDLRINIEIDELNIYLDNIKERLYYKHWYFGHFHADMKLPNNQTLIFNRVEELTRK
ncbi:hypothetical protein, partial [Paenibacillus sp. UNC451MF]|uniref:hypothetical protein n=1 Tax=Paenibacillus sp. UNC451MF TaxID=1449063 RepID=UPI00056A844D